MYRIRALRDFGDVKTGDRGGYIESEDNLSHEGECWVADEAKVYGNARVYEDAKVKDKAEVFDNADISGKARVAGNAKVYGKAQLSYGVVFDNAEVYGNAKISGSISIHGKAKVYKDTEITTGGHIMGNVKVTHKIHTQYGVNIDKQKDLERFKK